MRWLAASLYWLPHRIADGKADTFLTFKQNRYYRIYLASSVMLSIGFWLQNTAQFWLVLELTHSGMMVAYLAICQFGPLAVFGLFAGVIVDRLDRRLTLLCTEAGLMITSAILAALTLAGTIDVTVIFALAAVRSLILCVSNPAYTKFFVEIVGKKNLSNAIGLSAAGWNLARVISPALAGVIISATGAGICFAANAASYLLMLGTLFYIRPLYPAQTNGDLPPISLTASFVEGLRCVVGTSRLLILTVALFFITFIPMGFSITLPIFAMQTLGRDAAAFGILFSSLGVGCVAGSIMFASWGRTDLKWIFGSAAGLGIAEILLVFLRDLFSSSVILMVAGFCMTYFVVSIRSVLLFDTKEEMHGRVGALYSYILIGVGPLGSSISGWLSELGGTDLAFGVAGSIAIAVALAGVVAKSALPQLERREA